MGDLNKKEEKINYIFRRAPDSKFFSAIYYLISLCNNLHYSFINNMFFSNDFNESIMQIIMGPLKYWLFLHCF